MDSPSEPRLAQIADFLGRQAGDWLAAHRCLLPQDASTRRYIRLQHPDGRRAMLMDAPRTEDDPCPANAGEAQRRQMGWNAMTRLAASRVEAFTLIAGHLKSVGLNPPEVYAADPGAGLALIEDFGEGREFARLIASGAADEVALYRAAAGEIARLQAAPVPDVLQRDEHCWPILDFDELALASNADLFADWMPLEAGRPALAGTVRQEWERVRDDLITRAVCLPRAFTLRDYHAENLLWLGDGRVGLLDFQDAVRGWDVWDMAMLVQDARREVSPEACEAAIRAFLDLTGGDRGAFEERLAIIGTLNALRIAGVFARLRHRDGKQRYQMFQPRQLSILTRNLSHPGVRDMRDFVRRHMAFAAAGSE